MIEELHVLQDLPILLLLKTLIQGVFVFWRQVEACKVDHKNAQVILWTELFARLADQFDQLSIADL